MCYARLVGDWHFLGVVDHQDIRGLALSRQLEPKLLLKGREKIGPVRTLDFSCTLSASCLRRGRLLCQEGCDVGKVSYAVKFLSS
jgi:hypothetical protein